jgi:streptogramin lyase
MAIRSKVAPIATVLMLVLASCGDGGESPPREGPPPAEGPVELTLEEELEAELDIPDQPEWVATGFGSVWVTRDEAAAVERIDAETNEIVATIDVGAHPCAGIVAAYDSVWVPSCEEAVLYRIDPQTDKASAAIEIPIFKSTGALTTELGAAAGSIWMVTEGESGAFDALARIDPEAEKVVATIPLGYPGTSVAATEDAVWVTAPDDGVLIRVDPASDEVVAEVTGLEAPNFVAAGDEGVWVLSGTDSERSGGDGSVTSIDPETNEVASTVRIDEDPGQAADVTLGEGFVWVRTQYTLLAKIDPTTGQIVERYTDRKGLGAVVVDFGSVWLSDFAFNNVWRVPV